MNLLLQVVEPPNIRRYNRTELLIVLLKSLFHGAENIIIKRLLEK